MKVSRLETSAQLERLRDSWNCLARGVPFRTWQWLHSWWEVYGQNQTLYVLEVRDQLDHLVGIAPWYLDHTVSHGNVLRFLGSGDVCTDYLTLMATPEHEDEVARTVATWLTDAAAESGDGRDQWDLLCLDGVKRNDAAANKLAEYLEQAGSLVHARPGEECWEITLPDNWDAYLSMLSKSHRKQVRRALQKLDNLDRSKLHVVESEDQLNRAVATLTDLHQRRRQSLGQPGCFAEPKFGNFLNLAAPRLLQAGLLRLRWLQYDDRAVAAEFHLAGGQATYAYQSGVDPDSLSLEPGRLITTATIGQAIAEGQNTYDFLRGNEPYKAHWRAEPAACIEMRVVPRRTLARIRHGFWRAGSAMKTLIKQGWKPVAAQ